MNRTLNFIYLHDNHTATFLSGKTLDEILDHARRVEAEHTWGCLCPVSVMEGIKEVRSVGPFAHSHGSKDREYWHTQLDKWRAEVSADREVMRILEGRHIEPTHYAVDTVGDLIKLLTLLSPDAKCCARHREGYDVPANLVVHYEPELPLRESHIRIAPR